MVSLQDTASMPNTVTLLTGGSPWKKDGRSTTNSWGSNIMLLRLLHPRRGEKLQGDSGGPSSSPEVMRVEIDPLFSSSVQDVTRTSINHQRTFHATLEMNLTFDIVEKEEAEGAYVNRYCVIVREDICGCTKLASPHHIFSN
ncbi:hypothetical protein OPV22_016249 [Ensete ventricosum]|uniref:Uncharacterized protein n=1 Tax=Ensete ventricosum TaxID=4639 RepID=A0AAV8QZB3_ENSVE|nr:hypothetical protein OPV22_016249 [Ensete ventricosum]